MDVVNTENIEGCYGLLREICDEFNFESHQERIYNIDEMGMPFDPHRPKVIGAKGQTKL